VLSSGFYYITAACDKLCRLAAKTTTYKDGREQ